jgi:hypothetical protein
MEIRKKRGRSGLLDLEGAPLHGLIKLFVFLGGGVP